MKISRPRILSCVAFALVLASCAGRGRFVDPGIPESERRLVSDAQKLNEFDQGLGQGFGLAHGYSNGGAFSCYFDRNAGKVADGKLTLTVYEADGKLYGAEYRSWAPTFHYGYYAVRMKAANCPGIVSSFFTYTGRPAWDEIDIEFLGKNTRQVQFNYYTKGVGGHEFLLDLPFDAAEGFHEYGFDWQKDSITWYIDGVPAHTAKDSIPDLPQRLMMNAWSCQNHDEWSGALDRKQLPASVEYDFIAYIAA